MPLSQGQIKRKLFWYDFKTAIGVILAIALGTAFAFTGVAEVFAGLFLFYWYISRLRNRKIYEASLGVGRLHETMVRALAVLQGAQEFAAREYTGIWKLCPTCQSPYYPYKAQTNCVHRCVTFTLTGHVIQRRTRTHTSGLGTSLTVI